MLREDMGASESEEYLASANQQGGGDALAEDHVCRRFAPVIRAYGLRHLRSESEAADFCQQVLIEVVDALRRGAVREPERLGAFVLGVCRHQVADWYRSAARRRRLDAAVASTVIGKHVEAIERLSGERLRGCFQALPHRMQIVVLMSFQHEAEPAEIAESLRTTPANVRVLRHRALSQLRDCVGEGEQ